VSAATESAAEWRHKIADALEGVRFEHIRDGSWFRKILEQHARRRGATCGRAGHWDATYPGLDVEARADRHVERAARRAAAAGALASVGTSAGELLSVLTEGLGAPVGVPAAMLSMVVEGAYTTLLQLDLAGDLASIYSVPFGDDVDEMSILFALALGKEPEKKKIAEKAKTPRGLLSRLMELEDTAVATHIGKKLLEEAVLRNIVPIVGIGISARWNYVATTTFATRVRKYVRYRRSLTAACHKLRLADVKNPEVFVRGAWLLASCDGEPTREEMLAIAQVLEQFPAAERQLPTYDIDDEEAWFERVSRVPDEIDERLIDLLCLVAAIDKELAMAERRFLERLGKVLQRPVDFGRIDALCKHLRDGEDLADGFFGSAENPPHPSAAEA
jgi:hypothetical protein